MNNEAKRLEQRLQYARITHPQKRLDPRYYNLFRRAYKYQRTRTLAMIRDPHITVGEYLQQVRDEEYAFAAYLASMDDTTF